MPDILEPHVGRLAQLCGDAGNQRGGQNANQNTRLVNSVQSKKLGTWNRILSNTLILKLSRKRQESSTTFRE